MRKKRSAGSLLDVLKAQHFDAGISLTRRVAIKLARYFQTGATNYDPQIVDGTIGNLVGAFLMQLVASPVDRPDYGHLWGLGGVPATYNGDGTATPVFDAWGDQDTDIEPLTVDIGTQSLSNGAVGAIFRGTDDDGQELVFLGGGGSGGGSAGDWGDFSDGDVTLDGSTVTFLTGWTLTTNFDTHSNAINAGISQDTSYSGRPTFYKMVRNCWFDTLTINSGITLIPNGYRIYAREILGDGKISMNPLDYMDDGSGIGWASGQINLAGFSNFLAGGSVTLNTNGVGGAKGQNAPSLLDGLSGAHGTGWGGAGGDSGAKTGGATVKSICNIASYDRSSSWENLLGGKGVARADAASGGSGGGSDASHLGGQGGVSGGTVQINCEDMSGFEGTIDTSGSPGEAGDGSVRGYGFTSGFGFGFGSAATGGGGGGGGGGGPQYIVTATDGSYTAVAAGGAGGIAGASGTAGSAGTAGYIQRRLTT